MKRNHFPNSVQAKLDEYEQAVEHLTQQLARTCDAIDSARTRLGGGFQEDQEYRDLRATSDKLVSDKPKLESKLRDAQYTVTEAKAWLAGLSDGVVLEPVAATKPNGYGLAGVQSCIDDAEDEIAKLRAVPTPSADIRERAREHVAALARPKISGIATGQQLQVRWPDNVIAVLALLLPEQMTSALLKEVERQANVPMPLPQRKRRIAEQQAEIDTLQRQALALGASTRELPPAVVLGVRVAETKTTRAA